MIVVALDGFLRSQSKVPIPHAVKMFANLTQNFPTWVLADGTKLEAEHWLATRGLRDWVGVLGDAIPTRTGETLRQAQVAHLRARGPIELAVDPDPASAAWLVATGTPCLLHLHPSYSRPEFRPDAPGIRTWDEIQAELDRQEKMLVADARLQASDGSERLE